MVEEEKSDTCGAKGGWMVVFFLVLPLWVLDFGSEAGKRRLSMLV
jgi:hypothetical protein